MYVEKQESAEKGQRSGFEWWVKHMTFTQKMEVHVLFETKHHHFRFLILTKSVDVCQDKTHRM